MLKPFLHTSAKDLAVIEGLQELFIETEPVELTGSKETEIPDDHLKMIHTALLLIWGVYFVYSMAGSFIPSSMPSSTTRENP